MAQIKTVFKKTVQENGIVLYRQFKAEMKAFTATDGKHVDALPDRWVVGVICGSHDPVEGFAEARVLEEFKVDQKQFLQFTYGKPVTATFEVNGDRIKPLSLELKK